MSDIDVDALTREFFGQGMEPWRGQDWCEWAIDKDVAAAKERGLVAFVAARVEQDVRRQQREAVEAAIQAELDLHQCSFDELPVANQRFVQGMRRALEWMARGGSDVG